MYLKTETDRVSNGRAVNPEGRLFFIISSVVCLLVFYYDESILLCQTTGLREVPFQTSQDYMQV